MHICVCMCIYIYIYVHTYIHVYIHAHSTCKHLLNTHNKLCSFTAISIGAHGEHEGGGEEVHDGHAGGVDHRDEDL